MVYLAGTACLWPVFNSLYLFSAQTCNKYDVETRKPHLYKAILWDPIPIGAYSAVCIMYNTCRLFPVSMQPHLLCCQVDLAHLATTLLTKTSNMSAGGKPVDTTDIQTLANGTRSDLTMDFPQEKA